MKKLILLVFVLFISSSFAQTKNPYLFTPAKKRFEAYKQRLNLQKNSLLKNVKLKSIGPTVMSGRVVDVDVSPFDPTIFYVAYASGGLWKTTNNGISFAPLFDNQASMTIGDIAVDWKHGETIWVGTGEANSSRSSYAGTGIYKSNDTGKTWQSMGLAETQHIGRIIIDPDNPNTVLVAAVGHLYSPNKERGIFKTTDGGKTWRKTLYIDDNTGAIDLAIDPSNPKILYAAMWHRTRRAWNFAGSGKTSGIYKSTDEGDTWELITTKDCGFPTGKGVGRIGLAVYPKNPQIIYAVLDNQNKRPKDTTKEKPAINKDNLLKMTKGEFLKFDKTDIASYLDRHGFPKKYTVDKVIQLIKENKITPKDLVDYLSDANSELFETPVIGAEVYRSNDGGIHWKKTNKDFINDMFYSYGYYFGEIRVNPNNDKEIFLLGVPIIKSEDGGRTFKSIDAANVHGDFHALWLDPNRPGHLIIGNDGGLNISYDNGKTYFKANTPAVGQFYSVAVDMKTPFNVFGGLQDNGVWMGPSDNVPGYSWYASGHNAFKSILGGDGMDVAVDTTDNNTVYTGFQFGYYYRINLAKDETTPIKPTYDIGEKPLRFNWETPIYLSSHNHDIFYIGTNRLIRSLDRGKTYQYISGDLTKGKKDGDVPYGTLTTIDESPLKFGLIYTGSDDGLVYVTKDGGGNWIKISGNLPQDLWVSRVIASRYDTAAVYVTLNGYRWDDFNSYVYRSTDYGNTWEKIGDNLPEESVNVIREDPVNQNILYVGTDHGVYVSLDKGKTFMGLFKGMPAVPVHDLVIQPRDKKIVVGTHGRSLYVGDVSYIEKLTDSILSKKIYLFTISSKRYSKNWGNKNYEWARPYIPKLKFTYFAGNNGIAEIKIKTESGMLLKLIQDTCDHGLNFYNYDLSIDSIHANEYKDFVNKKLEPKKKDKFKTTDTKKIYLRPGKYSVEIKFNGKSISQNFEIKKPRKSPRLKD